LARVTDRQRRLVNDTVGIDHNVGLVECCDARFEIERDEGRIDLQTVQGSIVARYRGELAEVVIDTPT